MLVQDRLLYLPCVFIITCCSLHPSACVTFVVWHPAPTQPTLYHMSGRPGHIFNASLTHVNTLLYRLSRVTSNPAPHITSRRRTSGTQPALFRFICLNRAIFNRIVKRITENSELQISKRGCCQKITRHTKEQRIIRNMGKEKHNSLTSEKKNINMKGIP